MGPEELNASIGQLMDMLLPDPEPNMSSLGRGLLILLSFSSDPSATEADHANLKLVENGLMSWFDGSWQQNLGSDPEKARAKLITDIDRLVIPFRERQLNE